MFKWEYVTISLYSSSDMNSFTMQGSEGWELVQVVPALTFFESLPMAYAIFKRVLRDEEVPAEQEGFMFSQAS